GGIGEIPNPTRPARQAESIGSINAQRASDRSLRYGRRAVLIRRLYQIGIHGRGMSGISPPSCLHQIITKWDEMPSEEGIWETRGGREDFTYGRFQCWVALDRAIRLAAHRGRPGNVDRWTAERDRIYRQIMSHGWNPEKGTFTQHYGSDVLDASLLLMPLMDFVTP